MQRVLDEAIPDKDWRLQPFDPDTYTAHVERVLSEQDVKEEEEEDDELRIDWLAELKSVEQDEYTRYLVLHADVGGGSGRVLWQPWFPADNPELLEHDLTTDWVAALQQVREEGIENFDAAFTPKPDITVPDTARAIILEFPTGERQDDDADERPDPR